MSEGSEKSRRTVLPVFWEAGSSGCEVKSANTTNEAPNPLYCISIEIQAAGRFRVGARREGPTDHVDISCQLISLEISPA